MWLGVQLLQETWLKLAYSFTCTVLFIGLVYSGHFAFGALLALAVASCSAYGVGGECGTLRSLTDLLF